MFPTEPVPERIGAYKVIRRLTGSGSADMYLGRMEGPMGFQRVCALKLVPNAIEGDVRLAEELAREASICARLNHPAVVRMFDFFEHERRLVLVLEHVEGADLDRLLQNLARRRQKLGDEAIWYLAKELVGALAHAHAAADESGALTPVIHRNIQPENVLISWEGQVRLTGFGLGKILGRTPDTVVGTIKGTPGYMAPEQARGERVTPRADVYVFGVLLWSLLTGRRPPSDGTRPESVSKLRTDIPREIAAAIDAALEPSPDNRKITCIEIEQWIGKVAKLEMGRAELREKILMLRGARTPASEASATDTARTRAPRRRVSLRGIRASQRPPGPGPLSVPPPPSARPALRNTGRPATSNPSSFPSEAPDAASPSVSPAAWRPAVPDFSAAIDEILNEPPPGGRAMLATKPDPPVSPTGGPPPKRSIQRMVPGGVATAGETNAPQAAAPSTAPQPLPLDAIAEQETMAEPTGPGSWRDIEGTGSTNSAPKSDVHKAETRRARPLSVVESIGVASVTAGLVVVAGVLFASRSPPKPASTPTFPSAQPPVAVQVQSAIPRPDPSETPIAPPPTSTPIAAALGPDLPGGFGYITVTSTVKAMVFVNGILAGPTNEPVKGLCGRRFVRLGTVGESGGFPSWVAPGRTIMIPCQTAITVEIQPSPSPQ